MVKNSKKKNERENYGFTKKNISEAYRLIKKSKKITLLTHFKPDGDGISACAALAHALKKEGTTLVPKKVEVIYPSESLFKFKRKTSNLLINKHKQIPDLLIVLDTANYERVYYPKEFKDIPMINIDHHVSNSIHGTYNFIDPDASSTCEILFFLMEDWNSKDIDKYVAECLLFGILYDSQVFHTQSVYPKTLQASARLMEYGANLYKLKTELISNKNPQIINLWGKILSDLKIVKKGKAAWAAVTQKDLKKYDLDLSSLIGFNNFLSQISDVDVTMFFYQTEKGKTKVSLRSKKTDVNKLAAMFGGGGHKNAAGILTDRPINQLAKDIISKL